MTKILFYSDIHISAHKGKQERLQNCLDSQKWVIETAQQRGIKNIIFAGDLFQDRQRINVYAYHQTYDILSKATDVHLWLLLGNHDLWYYEKTDISSVIPIGALNHVTVIDKPTTHIIDGLSVDFLPFTHDPVSAINKHFQKKADILVAHIAVDGAVLNFHHKTKAEVSVEFENDMVIVSRDLFDGWKKVFLGHYHGAQKLTDKVEYIGSTLQLTFNEAFQKKHVIIMDTETLEKEYVENTFSPKHYIIKQDELQGIDLKNDFVRIYVDDISQTDVIMERMRTLEKSPDAQITFVQEKQDFMKDEDRAKKFNLSEGDILQRYIACENCEHLDKERLSAIGKEICLTNI